MLACLFHVKVQKRHWMRMKMAVDGRWGWMNANLPIINHIILTRQRTTFHLIMIHCQTLSVRHQWNSSWRSSHFQPFFRPWKTKTRFCRTFLRIGRCELSFVCLFLSFYTFLLFDMCSINLVVSKINTDVIYVSWTVKPSHPSHAYSIQVEKWKL